MSVPGVVSIQNEVPPTIWFIALASSSNFFVKSNLFSFMYSLFFIFLEFKVRVLLYSRIFVPRFKRGSVCV